MTKSLKNNDFLKGFGRFSCFQTLLNPESVYEQENDKIFWIRKVFRNSKRGKILWIPKCLERGKTTKSFEYGKCLQIGKTPKSFPYYVQKNIYEHNAEKFGLKIMKIIWRIFWNIVKKIIQWKECFLKRNLSVWKQENDKILRIWRESRNRKMTKSFEYRKSLETGKWQNPLNTERV